MTKSKFALVTALALIALSSQAAFAKTVRDSGTADNPYYAPYENTNTGGGSFPVGGFH